MKASSQPYLRKQYHRQGVVFRPLVEEGHKPLEAGRGRCETLGRGTGAFWISFILLVFTWMCHYFFAFMLGFILFSLASFHYVYQIRPRDLISTCVSLTFSGLLVKAEKKHDLEKHVKTEKTCMI